MADVGGGGLASNGGEHSDSSGHSQQSEHSNEIEDNTTPVDESNVAELHSNDSISVASSAENENGASAGIIQGFSSRTRRKTALTLVGMESKAYQLQVKISKAINSEYKYLNQIQSSLAEGVTLDTMYDMHESLSERANSVLATYNELVNLYNKDENKVASQTRTMFSQFVTHARELIEAIGGQLELLEKEEAEKEESMIQRMNTELEEEGRQFQELIKQSAGNSIQFGNVSVNRVEASSTGRNTTRVETTSALRNAAQVQTTPERINLNNIESTQAATQSNMSALVTQQHVQGSSMPQPQNSAISDQRGLLETNVMNKLAETLASAIGMNKRSVEPAIFENDVLHFSDWEVDLDNYLRTENIKGHERLRHLKRFVTGEARRCIEGHFVTNTDEAYLAARGILKERYGNQHNIARGFRKRLDEWPQIHPRNSKALTEFSDFLCHLKSAMSSISALAVLNDYNENEKMCQKLPDWLKLKWVRVVGQMEESKQRYPEFHEFSTFIREEARIMSLPISQSFNAQANRNKRGNVSESSKTTKASSFEADRSLKSYSTSTTEGCLNCTLSNHDTADCYRLQRMDRTQKQEFVKNQGICFRCYQKGHRSKGCNSTLNCLLCGKGHATANHVDNWKLIMNESRETTNLGERQNNQGKQASNPSQTTISVSHELVEQTGRTSPRSLEEEKRQFCKATCIESKLTNMAIPVYISAGTGQEMLVYALLDTMSDSCYVSPDVISRLGAKASAVERDVTIHTMNGPMTTNLLRYDDLLLRGYMNDNQAQISAYQRGMYCNKSQLPSPEQARRLPHLKNIANQIPPLLDIPVALLIGMNHTEVIQPLETRTCMDGKPFAVKTLFGWTMCGGKDPTVTRKSYNTYISKDTKLLDLLDQDFKDIEAEGTTSQEDLRFVEILEQGITRDSNGNLMMPLPFKSEPELPNNRGQAETRLKQQLRKLKTAKDDGKEYTKFMEDLISNGHAEEVTSAPTEPGKVWYLPHFGVRHKRKGKLRVVFDGKARLNNTSLNDMLLTGPDHINSLLGILLRFRRERIAVTCDIQQMFFNFKVAPPHRDYLRFLWTTNDDLETIKEFRMTVHLFGAKSSPAVATYGLRRLAQDNKPIYPEAADFLMNNFYVDDGVTSVATYQEAINLIQTATELCSKAGIRLHKYLSNDKQVLAAIPPSERGESTKSLDIFADQLPCDRTLGMEWNLETDTFHFTTPTPLNKPPTKRTMLSTIAQIYDPMGLISPVILRGKRTLQKCVSSGLSWDQLVPPDETVEWTRWTSEVLKLTHLNIPRCFKPDGNIVSTQLHHFSDASTTGYGACSYIRQIDDQGRVNCNLILAKSRVAPLNKPTTIPRLELQGAVTAVRLSDTLRKELHIKIDEETFWTDSNIVLGYLKNDSKRFHVYVANRVKQIKLHTNIEQWNHVATEDNPADIVSRGTSASNLMSNATWFQGPKFLQNLDISAYIHSNKANTTLPEGDPEVRKVSVLATIKDGSIVSKFNKFSDWNTLVRSIATLKHFARNKKWKMTEITPSNLQEAEEFIIKEVQATAYPTKERDKSLAKLHPYIDGTGLVRVGGRLENQVGLTMNEKHPVLIPKDTHISYLISKHYHESIYHLGNRSTLAAIREAGYWLVNGTGQVKSLIGKCVNCKRLRNKPETQLMGQLPEERLTRTPAFTHVGADIFGPFHVKDRRTELKRWGLLITCLYSRAVHIEVLEDMSSDSLIQALRCFMAIRGPVQTIVCDNGTNLVGAKNDLTKQFDIARPDLRQYLQQNRIVFKFNSPNASHQGGATERLIRSVRAVLNGMALKFKHRMDTKSLRTVFHEAANIVNNRPLSSTSITSPEDGIYTPNHLLTMKASTLVAPPPGDFPEENLYSRTRWKISQRVAEEFWMAWKTEYLSSIVTRQKWKTERENIKVGDIVMVIEENMARSDWRIGKITQTLPGKDGLVRNVEVTLGSKHLDSKGKQLQAPTVLKRAVNKIVLLLKA